MEDTKDVVVETRTLEKLLLDLRIENNYTYIEIVDKLSKLGLMVDEKTVKKWEYGLIYPSLDEIYIISELYMFPAINLITAKNNSLKEGMDSIHYTFIKVFCYITGLSMKVGTVILSCALVFLLIYAVNFFIECARMFMSSRRKVMNR